MSSTTHFPACIRLATAVICFASLCSTAEIATGPGVAGDYLLFSAVRTKTFLANTSRDLPQFQEKKSPNTQLKVSLGVASPIGFNFTIGSEFFYIFGDARGNDFVSVKNVSGISLIPGYLIHPKLHLQFPLTYQTTGTITVDGDSKGIRGYAYGPAVKISLTSNLFVDFRYEKVTYPHQEEFTTSNPAISWQGKLKQQGFSLGLGLSF